MERLPLRNTSARKTAYEAKKKGIDIDEAKDAIKGQADLGVDDPFFQEEEEP